MEEITVPFSLKAKARELGAFFNKENRKWYIPDLLPEGQKRQLRSLNESDAIPPESEPVQFLTGTIPDNSDTFIGDIDRTINNTFSSEWRKTLEKEDVLYTLLAYRDYGVPCEEEQRIRALQLLSRRRPGDYPVSYDGICACCPQFEEFYPMETIVSLIQNNVTGISTYTEEIRSSGSLSEEEKALLLFVIPL